MQSNTAAAECGSVQGVAMRALLSARLQAYALDGDTAPSASGNILASWLLVWLLSSLNRAAAQAAADPTADSASLDAAAAAVRHFIGMFQQQLQQRDVEELLRRRGWPDLIAHVTQVYQDPSGHILSALSRVLPPNASGCATAEHRVGCHSWNVK
jgi:hypothetical protein